MKRLVLTGVVVAAAVGGGAVALLSRPATALPTAPPSLSTATIERSDLSTSTLLSGTLGYSGSFTVATAAGTSSADIVSATAAEQAASAKVHQDEHLLEVARALSNADPAVTSASQAVTAAQATLRSARALLSADQSLGCPPTDAGTVSSADAGSSAGSGGTAVGHFERSHDVVVTAPVVATGTATLVTTTAATLSGTVDPGNGTTSYEFRYGTTAALTESSGVAQLSASADATSVSAVVGGLTPATTYDFELTADNAAGSASGQLMTLTTSSSACVAEQQVVASDEAALTLARETLSSSTTTAGASITAAEDQLSADQSAESSVAVALQVERADAGNPARIVTALPAPNAAVTRGESVFGLGGYSVPLLYGSTVPTRALMPGVSDGADVAELNANLAASGYVVPSSAHFSAATETALRRFQAAHGMEATGELLLGDVVLATGPIHIGVVDTTLGATLQPGSPVLSATSVSRVVTVLVDPANAPAVNVGDAVSILLASASPTPGRVTAIGAAPPGAGGSGGGGSGGEGGTQITVAPEDPAATGTVVDVPVQVAFTTSQQHDVLAAPVSALLALSGGGYGVEVVEAGGTHRIVAVQTGLFSGTKVAVTGSGITAGTKVVVAQ